MLKVHASFAVAVALTVPMVASAAQTQLVVLRFAGDGFAKPIIDSATSGGESAALRVSGGRFKIVTRDMLAAVVGEEKLMKCEAAA